MKKTILGAALTGFCLSGAGCASVPKVAYERITAPPTSASKDFDTLALADATITIAVAPSKAASGTQAATPASIAISSKLTDDFPTKIGVKHADDFWTKTQLSYTKLDNTDIPSAANITVTNNVVALTNEVGSFVTALIPLTHAVTESHASPTVLADPSQPTEIALYGQVFAKHDARSSFTDNSVPGVAINFGPVPVDAVDTASFDFSKVYSTMIYAACRSASVTVTADATTKSVTAEFKVPDPNYLQQVTFPNTGTVAMHSQCGASVTLGTSTDTTDALTIATAIATNAKAISDAVAAAKATQ